MDEQQAQQVDETGQQVTREQLQRWGVSVLVSAAKMSQQRGVFSLEEAALVSKAVNIFAPSAPEVQDEEASSEEDKE